MVIYRSINNNNLIKGIRDKKIAVIPTDTIYGIVACATNESSVKKVYAIKNRTPDKPFIILIADVADLGIFNVSLPIDLLTQLKDYWPGPSSIILSCDNPKFDYLSRGTKSLAFRLPDDKKLTDFIRKTGPLIAPSANPEGKKPAIDINDAIGYFNDQIDYYVDSGRIIGHPSHLIDFTSGSPIKIR
jgi:L-threonylcarbamoyladenylate synthase